MAIMIRVSKRSMETGNRHSCTQLHTIRHLFTAVLTLEQVFTEVPWEESGPHLTKAPAVARYTQWPVTAEYRKRRRPDSVCIMAMGRLVPQLKIKFQDPRDLTPLQDFRIRDPPGSHTKPEF